MGVPSLSASSSIVPDHKYVAVLDQTKSLIFAGRGNLYAFYIEDNGGADCFIQFFDATATVDVTVGSTVPDFTFRVVGGSALGKDTNDSPLHFFNKGCVVAVTSSRTGSGAPAAGASAQFWSHFARYQG